VSEVGANGRTLTTWSLALSLAGTGLISVAHAESKFAEWTPVPILLVVLGLAVFVLSTVLVVVRVKKRAGWGGPFGVVAIILGVLQVLVLLAALAWALFALSLSELTF